MPYEQKDNSGVLFPVNDKKTEKHPDHSGNIRINGVDYWLSGWNKVSDKGERITLSATKKENKAEKAIKEVFPDAKDDQEPIPF